MILKRALKLFLDDYQNPGTKHAYLYALRPMSDFIGPSRPLESIKPEHLVEYSHILQSRPIAPATVRKNVKAIKTFFNWCIRLNLITDSPATAIKARRLSNKVPKSRAMTDTELESILEVARHKFYKRDYALVLFVADSGCRVGGAAGLRVEDLDFEVYTALVTEKGDKTRPVAFGADCANALREWLLQRPAVAGIYVFSRTENPVAAANLSQAIRRLCLKAGIRSLGSHSLRHRKGHQFADAKVAPSIAATALGHSDVTITLQHYYPRDWDRALAEIRKLSHKSRKPAASETIIELPNRRVSE